MTERRSPTPEPVVLWKDPLRGPRCRRDTGAGRAGADVMTLGRGGGREGATLRAASLARCTVVPI